MSLRTKGFLELVYSSRGQALIESLITGLALLSITLVVFAIVIWMNAHFQIQNALDDVGLCVLNQSQNHCRREFFKSLKPSLVAGEVSGLWIQVDKKGASQKTQARVTYKIKLSKNLGFQRQFESEHILWHRQSRSLGIL